MTELPTTFGKYFLTEKLATGGMAEIYLAKLVGPGGFEKSLVIKQIHPRLSGQRHFVDLFVAEAKMLVALAHGNIVPVYELGVVDDTYFIAMEYIDGPTLYRLTEAVARRDHAIDPALAAWITARIVEGLDYAHRKGDGLIHRDLSPRNVMLSRDGEVKLVDFGIAVTLGEPGETAGGGAAPTGSFPYMSPEQVRREPLTGQTDLFSVGVLLWEMLVGQRLFARADADATLAAVLGAEIARPSAERPEVPAKLDEVVMRALARDRADRWPAAADMLGALNRYLYGLEDTPGPREVAALVARFCPPETRRLPTEAEGLVLGSEDPAAGGEVTSPREGSSSPGSPDAVPRTPTGPAPGGPRTVIIPRDGEAAPSGKRMPRQQSFATHVELKDMLERATPLFGYEALHDDPIDPVGAPAPASRAGSIPATPIPAHPAISERTVPSRQLLVVGGLAGLAMAVAAVFVFIHGREAVLSEPADAGVPHDASIAIVNVADAAPATPADAASIIPRPDASALAPPPDAAIRNPLPPPDAAVRVPPPPARDAAPATPTGTATLVIGAAPWAEIYIDGAKRGHTPATLTAPAGHHTVELVFDPPDEPAHRRSFDINPAPGAQVPLQADFTHVP